VADDQAFMQQLAPRYQAFALTDPIAQQALRSLNIPSGDLLRGTVPTLVNTGNSFLIIGLASEQTLAELQPDFGQIQQISEQLDLIGYYLFTPPNKLAARLARACSRHAMAFVRKLARAWQLAHWLVICTINLAYNKPAF